MRDPESLKVEFRVTDFAASVPVEYVGILPDLFAEGQGVVAMGRLNADGRFVRIRCLPNTMRTICHRKWPKPWSGPQKAGIRPLMQKKPRNLPRTDY